MFADIDHFKRFNDVHGHLAGDEALVAVAGALRGGLRSCDLLGRFGGEEFCLLLPGCAEDEAARLAEGLRLAVEAIETSATPSP